MPRWVAGEECRKVQPFRALNEVDFNRRSRGRGVLKTSNGRLPGSDRRTIGEDSRVVN